MPAMDLNLGGNQNIVAGGPRPGLIFRRDSFFFRQDSRQNAGLYLQQFVLAEFDTIFWPGSRVGCHSGFCDFPDVQRYLNKGYVP